MITTDSRHIVDVDGLELIITQVTTDSKVLLSLRIGDGPEIEIATSDPAQRQIVERIREVLGTAAEDGAKMTGRSRLDGLSQPARAFGAIRENGGEPRKPRTFSEE